MIVSPYFDKYRQEPSFGPRPPIFLYRDHEDEAEDLSKNPLVLSLAKPLAGLSYLYFVESEANGSDIWINGFTETDSKYLWLVRTDDVKIALENGELRRRVTGGSIKHTNLTSGVAHCGGELWFSDDQSLFINGGSGRFTPRSKAELEAVVSSLRDSGYRVCSFGGSDELGAPTRVLRKADIRWQ